MVGERKREWSQRDRERKETGGREKERGLAVKSDDGDVT